MGVSDRDYTKADWGQTPYQYDLRAPMGPAVLAVLGAHGIALCLQLVMALLGRSEGLAQLLYLRGGVEAFSPQGIAGIFLSWLFLPGSPWWALSLIVGFWALARALERELGGARLLWLYLGGNVAGAVLCALFETRPAMAGPLGGVFALAFAFPFVFPRMTVWGGFRMMHLVVALGVIAGVTVWVSREPSIPRFAMIAGIALGISDRVGAGLRFHARRMSQVRAPVRRPARKKMHVRVPDSLPDELSWTEAPVNAGSGADTDSLRRRINELLDKANELGGVDKLSDEDRAFLTDAGRRLRG